MTPPGADPGRGTAAPTILSWSGGKDCCMALHAMRRDGCHAVRGLLTTIADDDGRIPIHGVSRDRVLRQAAALGLPIRFVPLPVDASNQAYEAAFGGALASHRADGVTRIAFGDLFLADIRAYRERLVAPTGLTPVFPLWGTDTAPLAHAFVAAGFRAIVVSVDLAVLSADFAGRPFDAAFLAALPAHVDPCGENGEFHSFVWDGPGFAAPIDVRPGAIVSRSRHAFCDIG